MKYKKNNIILKSQSYEFVFVRMIHAKHTEIIYGAQFTCLLQFHQIPHEAPGLRTCLRFVQPIMGGRMFCSACTIKHKDGLLESFCIVRCHCCQLVV